jgi:deoxycytidine triphosphate deaminase
MLSGQELKDKQIITKIPEENISQHGIDLNVIKIEKQTTTGFIPVKGKTQIPEYQEIFPINNIWELQPGHYSVVFEQGCNVPSNQMLLIRQRSSLLRCGGIVCSSVFDAGFKTDNIGTFITLFQPIKIEVGSRIAQIYNHKSNKIKVLYNGQFQNDKQRKK